MFERLDLFQLDSLFQLSDDFRLRRMLMNRFLDRACPGTPVPERGTA